MDFLRPQCFPQVAWVRGSQEKLLGLGLCWLCAPGRHVLSTP